MCHALQSIFRLFVNQLQFVSQTSAPNYKQYYYLLEVRPTRLRAILADTGKPRSPADTEASVITGLRLLSGTLWRAARARCLRD